VAHSARGEDGSKTAAKLITFILAVDHVDRVVAVGLQVSSSSVPLVIKIHGRHFFVSELEHGVWRDPARLSAFGDDPRSGIPKVWLHLHRVRPDCFVAAHLSGLGP